MLRIGTRFAEPGMILLRPVYDPWGQVLVEEGIKITSRHIELVEDAGVGEIFVADSAHKLNDIAPWPMISPELEGETSKTLRRILLETRNAVTGNTNRTIDVGKLTDLTNQMLEQLMSPLAGDPAVTGCFSLRYYNYVHPVKVASLAMYVGRAAGIEHDTLINIGVAALLQNIGYVPIPRGIVERVGLLSAEESRVVQKHPSYGAQILARWARCSREINEIVLQHHERWNGTGYPNQLAGSAICIGARIIGMVDTCFALASKRPHREEFLPAFAIEHSIVTPMEAVDFILAYSGELFDPALVTLFATHVPVYPTGVKVKLSNGQLGVVVKPNSATQCRPQIQLYPVSPGKDEGEPVTLDLSLRENRNLMVSETCQY
jgi:HD-GYP domain-containing protein (c-di-GMP phosphodiesterase class II)